MVTVLLQGAEFFARHGFYPEEQLLGGWFVVDLSVGFAPNGDLNEDNLATTVNYEELYTIISLQMQESKKLIETAAQAIIDEIRRQYPFIETATITIKKLNPPMKGKVAYSGVSITYNKP
ncbi:MAG: dihydroneopterin aldolase [Mucilaginibacter sp.]